MKCQFCSNPATVHLTKLVKKQKLEVHLCEACAEKHQAAPADLSLSSILESVIGQHISPVAEELGRLICPTCGIKYMEFRADGRLGCPADYEVFRRGLVPILQRIHRATRHAGKSPRRRRSASDPAAEAELLDLRQQLRRAVGSEDYETAAALRDLIRQKEGSDELG
ncbi:MAG TPA: UvrB/UvrC motif-containing protein [Gemmataceae bacterium]|jgi:protein arginine kinase activator|nr:UvrB/UvrC motif-containing protein [Gemmataceae bacterium]